MSLTYQEVGRYQTLRKSFKDIPAHMALLIARESNEEYVKELVDGRFTIQGAYEQKIWEKRTREIGDIDIRCLRI